MSRSNADAERMHAANPHIWEAFERIALQIINSQMIRHWGARAVWEIMRYDAVVRGIKGDVLKLTNDWHPWYARKFVEAYPQHANFFTLRQSQFDAPDEPSPQSDLFEPS